MSKAKELGIETRTFWNGKPAFIAGVLEALNIPGIINAAAQAHKTAGRNPDIPYGTIAKLMLINICDHHAPLYRLNEYYLDKDLPLLAGDSVKPEMIHDDRFGVFLDHMHAWGPRAIFNAIASNAFLKYDLRIRSVNYDTTSKVMWGAYEGNDGKTGVISITFGHSKEKRNDKNQIKMAIGTSGGVLVDARPLSGNADDKTFNNENLDDVNNILPQFKVDKNEFYYISDSAFFTEENLKKAFDYGIQFITRVPETISMTKELIERAWAASGNFKEIGFEKEGKEPTVYQVQGFTDKYRDMECQFAVCYSPSLEQQKQKTAEKQIPKELERLQKMAKPYAKKRFFACELDAQKEIEMLTKKRLGNIRYHNVSFIIIQEEKKRRGRPKKDEQPQYVYRLVWDISANEEAIKETLKREATFVLATNDVKLSAGQILAEYKTQSSVEKKFQQLKSPHFVNSLFLKKPERVEALVYLILIAMLVLSVIEKVVRREMKKEDKIIIGPGKVKMKQPSLRAIVDIFGGAPVNREIYKGEITRYFADPLNDSQLSILKYLGVPPDTFLRPY